MSEVKYISGFTRKISHYKEAAEDLLKAARVKDYKVTIINHSEKPGEKFIKIATTGYRIICIFGSGQFSTFNATLRFLRKIKIKDVSTDLLLMKDEEVNHGN